MVNTQPTGDIPSEPLVDFYIFTSRYKVYTSIHTQLSESFQEDGRAHKPHIEGIIILERILLKI